MNIKRLIIGMASIALPALTALAESPALREISSRPSPLSFWQRQSLERKFEVARPSAHIEIVSDSPSIMDRLDETFIGSAYNDVAEIKREQGILDINAFGFSGTVRIKSALIWDIAPHTSRQISSSRHRLWISQSYSFRNEYDAESYLIRIGSSPFRMAGNLLRRAFVFQK